MHQTKKGNQWYFGMKAHITSDDTSDAYEVFKRSEFIKMRVVIVIMITLVFIPCNSDAYELEAIKKDVVAYLEAVRGGRNLRSFHYFEGEAGESELELELQACASLGVDAYSDKCIAYTRCRWERREQVPSYYFAALSQVLPSGKIDKIWVNKGVVETLPHVMVHAKVGKHTLTFFRPTCEDAYVPFGRLSLALIDGKSFELSSLIDFAKVLSQDSCTGQELAGQPAPFVISCDKVESILVELAYDLESFERRAIDCHVELTSAAGVELDAHCAKWFGDMPGQDSGDSVTSAGSSTGGLNSRP